MKIIESIFILVLLLSFISTGCSRTDHPEIRIPQYPGAVEDQQHDAEVLGMPVGTVKRLITSDSYDKVFAFYEEHLAVYDPEVVTYDLDDGRQTAFTVKEDRTGTITLAVQESREEGKVAITFMRVGF
jgi:hypothetical protein